MNKVTYMSLLSRLPFRSWPGKLIKSRFSNKIGIVLRAYSSREWMKLVGKGAINRIHFDVMWFETREITTCTNIANTFVVLSEREYVI